MIQIVTGLEAEKEVVVDPEKTQFSFLATASKEDIQCPQAEEGRPVL